jgi:prevent-host-death family protein
MLKLTATEARNNIGQLWSAAMQEPVMVESAGKPLAVVLSPQAYEKLCASPRKPRVAGTGAKLLSGVDVSQLLDIDITGVFSEYL